MRLTILADGGKNLAELLAETGHPLDLRCGGNGTCGRCRVRLCSGEWETDGRAVTVPAEVSACRTRLTGTQGDVELPEHLQTIRQGKIAAAWQSRPLPESRETVIAVDLGTTTVAAVKIRNGKIVREATGFNRQNSFGDNVISRINHAGNSPEALEELRTAATDSIAELLVQLDSSDAVRIAVAGNTVMSCLFHGIEPASIGMLPFTPPARIFPERRDLFGGIPVLTVPCISGYVGGDLTAGLFEINPAPGEMLVDIGTNCEIIFNTPSGMICTAAAAGPAFEGAGLHFGCRAAEGAIDHYYGTNDFSVLGGMKPHGFCGSAYLDFLAVERRNGHLNEFGRYEPKAELMRVTDELFIHEYDIAQLLKAKSAVWAGIRTLEDSCGLHAEKIYLAGGFAQYLDLKSAIATGMLPDRPYQIVGNSSLAGAARLAVEPDIMTKFERLIDRPNPVVLNTLSGFEDNFIDGMLLP